MLKLTIFAITSFFVLALISCTDRSNEGPAILLKKEPPAVNLSFDKNKAEELVYTYRVGPYDLPAETPATQMEEQPGSMRFNIEDVAWLTSFEPKIEDSEGNELPKELVQSLMLINHGEENSFCTTKQVGNPFAAMTSIMEKISGQMAPASLPLCGVLLHK